MSKRKIQRAGNDVSNLITIAEAARLRGVSRSAISELVRRGRLRSIEMFGRVLVYRSEVESFQKQKPGPKTEAE
jgi:excisionase family DNA binding protein